MELARCHIFLITFSCRAALQLNGFNKLQQVWLTLFEDFHAKYSSHTKSLVAQAVPKLTMQLKMTLELQFLILLPPLLKAGVAGMPTTLGLKQH